MAATEKICTNPGCGFLNMKVKVEADKCIGCNRDLKPTLGSISDILDGAMKDVQDIFKDIR